MAKAKKTTAKKAVKKAAAPKKAARPAKKAAPAKKSAPKAKAKPAAKKPSKPAPKPAAKKAAPAKKEVKKAKPAPVKKPAAKPVAAKAKTAPVAGKNEPKFMLKKPEYAKKPATPAKEDNRPRYNDSELKEFKVLILGKLEEATRDYELLKATLSHKDDHGTDDTSPTFKLLEDGSDVLSKEETAHLAARQEKYIQNLRNALLRIENKTYGICRVTGKLIPKERLRSVPHATLSIDAKLEQYK
ncbi:MAG: DNAK suppressor protein [Bacteroidetes bacterium]|nr:MAG: DNAK suppressor protein [Bacteroidota bacterium]